MKWFKKFIKVLIWPLIFAIVQFFIQYIFVYIFNFNEIKKLRNLYPRFSNEKINNLLNELIKTIDYKNRLNDYINSNTLLIILIIFIVLLPILYMGYKKYKTNDKIKCNNIIILILLGVSIGLTYNICVFNLNNIFNFTNQFNLSPLPIYVQIISSGIVGPILEELTFRGIVYNELKKFNSPLTAMILSTLIFSLMHTNIVNVIYTLIIGIILILVYKKYNNIKSCITLHMSANIIVILFTPVLIRNHFLLNFMVLFISILIIFIIYLKKFKNNVYFKK